MIKKIIFPILIIIAFVVMIILGVIFQNYNYLQWIDIVIEMFDNTDLKPTILAYVSEDLFKNTQKAVMLICIIGAICIAYTIQYRDAIQQYGKVIFSVLWMDCKQLFSATSFCKLEKRFLYICILAIATHSMYYIHTWALQHDECWTYNYFIKHHILASFIAPNNNHNLYTLICWFVNLILDGKWAMRLVALAGGLASVWIFAKFMHAFKNETLSLIAIVMFSNSLPLLDYCIIGRSYSFTILFTTLGLLCIQKIISFPNSKKYYYYFAISQALGLFSNIGYLYPLIGFVLITLFLISKNTGVLWVKCWTICGIISLMLLGIPLLVLHGLQPLQAVINNSVFDWQHISSYIQIGADTISFYFTGITHLGIWYFAILLGGSILLLFTLIKHNATILKRKILYLCFLQFSLPFLFFAMQQSYIFHRMFTYEIVFFTIFISLLLYSFLNLIFHKFPIWRYALLLLFPISFYGFTKHVLFRWSANIDIAAKQTASYLLSKKIDTCYNFYFYAVPAIHYYFHKNQSSIYFIKSKKGSISYQAFDSSKHYQCILSASEDNMQFVGYKKTVIDDVVDIWE